MFLPSGYFPSGYPPDGDFPVGDFPDGDFSLKPGKLACTIPMPILLGIILSGYCPVLNISGLLVPLCFIFGLFLRNLMEGPATSLCIGFCS